MPYTDQEFIQAWHNYGGSPTRIAQALGITDTSVYKRRQNLEKRGVRLNTVPGNVKAGTGANGIQKGYGWRVEQTPFRQRMDFKVRDGYAIFFGDCHWWPGEMSLANKALLILLKRIKPKFIAANGDLFDGARISRHEPLGWVKLPTVIEELSTVRNRLDEIERACPSAMRYFSPGNHDTRYDRRLATEISEFESVPGMRIEDHLQGWPMAYVAVLNGELDVPVLVMHNFKGGVHATWNNAIHAGSTIITGHLHSQERKAHTTYFRTSYGVDHGCLADPDHPAFSYTMGRPKNWRSGFCVMRFDKEGRHFPPSFLEVQVFKTFKRAVFNNEIILEEKREQMG